MNPWISKIVAFAYRYQQEAQPYKELITDFSSLLTLRGGEEILDVGCGGGRLMRLSWEKSGGNLKRIVGLDSAKHALAYAEQNTRRILRNIPHAFIAGNISEDLPFGDRSFDVVTSGLCLQYAEHWDGERWTRQAYHNIYREIYRVLKPGGKLVFSVNTPNPDFSIIARKSWREIFLTWKMPLNLLVALIMVSQARFLVREAARGRYHYIDVKEIEPILKDCGFEEIRHKKSYAGLAWAIACRRP